MCVVRFALWLGILHELAGEVCLLVSGRVSCLANCCLASVATFCFFKVFDESCPAFRPHLVGSVDDDWSI